MPASDAEAPASVPASDTAALASHTALSAPTSGAIISHGALQISSSVDGAEQAP
jgi:hypothetical protein